MMVSPRSSSFSFLIAVLLCGSPLAADDVDPVVTDDHVLTRFDAVPRFCKSPTIEATASGAWSSPSTWAGGVVPGANARVALPSGVVVTYDVSSDSELHCIEVAGEAELRWATDRSTRLRLLHLQVLPGGGLVIGERNDPIDGSHLAEIIFSDAPLDTAGVDPSQYGNGLHVFGSALMYGRRMGRSFVRFAEEATAGASALSLERSTSGWRPGDRVLIPDTRQIAWRKNLTFVSQAEVVELATAGGASVAIDPPLAFDHYGPRDANGQVGPVEAAMLPHVGNLSRSVVLRSVGLDESSKSRYCRAAENLTDTENCVTRGHIMIHARAAADLRYASFLNLGRTTIDDLDSTVVEDDGTVTHVGTNQVGRYSIHLHHLAGPVNASNSGDQFTFVGNVVEGFFKWGLAVHDTHYGLVQDNVFYDGIGSAVATEDGNESFNVFARNLVVHTKAGDSEQIVENTDRGGVKNNRDLFGITRDGFWFSGMNNYVRDNVVANSPDFAYNYNGYYLDQDQPIPDFRGADMETDSTLATALPVLQSTRNEAYGATGQGLWLTWSRGCCRLDTYEGVSLFRSFRIWHVNNAGVEAYHDARNTFDDFVLRNDTAVTAESEGGSLRFNRGFHLANQSYENGQTVLRRIDAQGFNVGIQLPLRPEEETGEPNVTVVRDSFLKNYVNLQEHLPNMGERVTEIRSVAFEPLDIPQVPGQPEQPTNLEMFYEVDKNTDLVGTSGKTFLRRFNGSASSNWQIFFEEQAPDYPIPPPPEIDHPNYLVCPEIGLTQQECWTNYGIAIGGEVAPCVEVDGDPTCEAARLRAQEMGVQGLAFPAIGNQRSGRRARGNEGPRRTRARPQEPLAAVPGDADAPVRRRPRDRGEKPVERE